MRTLHVVSFDPGIKGAVAWVSQTGTTLLEVQDLPLVENAVSPVLLLDMLIRGIERYGMPLAGVVERQQPFPKQGVSSGHKNGIGYGVIMTAVVSQRIPLVLRSPSEWKRHMHLTKDKERSRKAALDRWPACSDWFKLKKNEGRAEAALLGVSYLLELEGKDPLTRGDVSQSKETFKSRKRVVRSPSHTQV